MTPLVASRAPPSCSCARIATAARDMWTCISTSSGCASRTCSTRTASRRSPDMRRQSSLAVLLLVLSIGACVSTGSGLSIARLEQQRSAAPASLAANRALGVAYYKAGRHADAFAALQTAARLDPNDGTTALYLGLTAEELGDYAAAKRAYATYLKVGRTSRVRRQLEGRLAELTRRELAEEAKRSIQQERTLGAVAGSPTTVAVLPLRFTGSDSSLRPLERGFAELLTT